MKKKTTRVELAGLMLALSLLSTNANAMSVGVNAGGFLDIFGGTYFDDYTLTGSGTATLTTLDYSWSLTTDGVGNLSMPAFITGTDSLDFTGSGSGTRTFTFCDDGGTGEVCGSIPILSAVPYDFVTVTDPYLGGADTGLYDAGVTNFGLDLLSYEETALVTTIAAVPIPGAVWLLGSAFGLLGWVRRRNA